MTTAQATKLLQALDANATVFGLLADEETDTTVQEAFQAAHLANARAAWAIKGSCPECPPPSNPDPDE